MLDLLQSYTAMCSSSKIKFQNRSVTKLEFAENVTVTRPKPKREIDQIYMLPVFTLLQGELLRDYVNNKNLIFIGDGDHISVILAKLCNPKSITVLDIDERVLTSIKAWGKRIGFNIKTVHYDIFDALPLEFRNNYDFFYTNPPYGSKCEGESVIAFAKRGIEACKEGSLGCLVIPHQEHKPWTITNMLKIQKFLFGEGYLIEAKINDLHQYALETEPELTSCNLIVRRMDYRKPSWEGKAISNIKGFY